MRTMLGMFVPYHDHNYDSHLIKVSVICPLSLIAMQVLIPSIPWLTCIT